MTTATRTRLTAPLPLAAAAALSRLERAFAAPRIVQAVTRFEVASARTAELSRLMDTRDLSRVEFDSLFAVQDELAMCRRVLAEAGLLHLVGVSS